MQIKISLPVDTPKEGLLNLKNFIDNAGIEGLEKTEIDRAPHGEGQMGVGVLLNSIATIISAATDPLVQLVKCLQKYVENYRTRITIPTKDGNIVLEHGRGMTPEQLKELVVSIQNSNR